MLGLIICDFSFHSETGPRHRWMVNSSRRINGWCTGNRGFPCGSVVKNSLQCQRRRFNPWVGEDALEKEMSTHSSILAWKIPWTEEPGGLQSVRSQRVRHDWSDLACPECGIQHWFWGSLRGNNFTSSAVAPERAVSNDGVFVSFQPLLVKLLSFALAGLVSHFFQKTLSFCQADL